MNGTCIQSIHTRHIDRNTAYMTERQKSINSRFIVYKTRTTKFLINKQKYTYMQNQFHGSWWPLQDMHTIVLSTLHFISGSSVARVVDHSPCGGGQRQKMPHSRWQIHRPSNLGQALPLYILNTCSPTQVFIYMDTQIFHMIIRILQEPPRLFPASN